MLGHNETQLDSYNKNIPRAQGPSLFIQALSLQIGSSSAITATTTSKAEPQPKPTSQKSTKLCSRATPSRMSGRRMTPSIGYWAIRSTNYQGPKIISMLWVML